MKAYYKLSLDRNFVYLIAIRSTSQTNLNFNVNQENPNDIIVEISNAKPSLKALTLPSNG